MATNQPSCNNCKHFLQATTGSDENDISFEAICTYSQVWKCTGDICKATVKNIKPFAKFELEESADFSQIPEIF